MSIFFFFSSRRRHTRFDCDWSSDVCSSDLEGKDRRSAETSPLRARRRLVTPEVLRQVKGIELRTRSLVSSLFTGEYRSMFRGRSEEHTSELQSQSNLVCRLLLEKKKRQQ